MGRMLTQLELMQASTLIQNRRIMPRTVTPQDVVERAPFLESPITGMPQPSSAEDVVGMSDGVQAAKRREASSA